MESRTNFFEYMFYRVAKAYSKWDIVHGSTGVAAVICCQLFLIIDIAAMFVYMLFDKPERTIIFKYFSIGIIIMILILGRYNDKKFKNLYWTLHKRWKDESKQQKIRNGIIVILAILLPVLIPCIVLYLIGLK